MDLSRSFRAFTITLLVCAGSGGTASELPSHKQQDDIRRSLSADVPDGFTVASVGDIQLTHPVSRLRDPGFQAVLSWVRNADIAVGNLETTLIDANHFVGYPGTTHDSLRPIGTPGVADDLNRMGFDLLARANNHATDWSIAGMANTDNLLDAAHVIHAGTGPNLAIARAAQYVEGRSRRIGLVSFTTTFEAGEPALAPLGRAPARAGASTLRTTPVELVDHEAFRALSRILAAQPPGSATPQETPGMLSLFGTVYRDSDHFGTTYEVNQKDRDQILRAIRQGKLASDFVVVNIHSHEPGNWSDVPADFLPAIAHAAIDAGADVIMAEGPHHLRGIELYKGKPIFYSLGNFIIQFAPQSPVAEDMYEKLDGDPNTLSDAELIQSRIGVHVEQLDWYRSVVAVTRFVHGQVADITLHPIELSLNSRMADRGIPRAAEGKEAQEILERLKALSSAFGTPMEIENGTGIIRGVGP